MPVYEYECKNCGEKFEVLRGFKDKKIAVKCPKCGVSGTHRMYSLFGRGSSASSRSPIPRSFG